MISLRRLSPDIFASFSFMITFAAIQYDSIKVFARAAIDGSLSNLPWLP
jgi:hypothetical protein